MLGNFRVREMETTTQLVFDDLMQYDDLHKLNAALLKIQGVSKTAVKRTFEGELFNFSYQDMRFSTFFEEFGDEVVISVPKPQDPAPLIKLMTIDN
ncbi:MAG TPA: hypothetical protein PKB13_07575 [Clostridia bacterium]|nr:hypothetical protein [Clostridia bacterium]